MGSLDANLTLGENQEPHPPCISLESPMPAYHLIPCIALALLGLAACTRHQTESQDDYAPTTHAMSDEDCSQPDVQESLRHAINTVLAEESRKTSSLLQSAGGSIAAVGLLGESVHGFIPGQGFAPGTLISAIYGTGSYEFSHFHGDDKLCYVNVKVSVDVGGVGPTVENEPVSYTVLYVAGKPAVKIEADSMRRISRDLNATPMKQLR